MFCFYVICSRRLLLEPISAFNSALPIGGSPLGVATWLALAVLLGDPVGVTCLGITVLLFRHASVFLFHLFFSFFSPPVSVLCCVVLCNVSVMCCADPRSGYYVAMDHCRDQVASSE